MKMYKASHILVTHEYEAQDLLRLLQHGQSFESLAAKYSKCSSAKQNGFLGEIQIGRAHPEFEEAMLSLKPNQVSKPVRTPFGWHLIRREN